MLPGTQPPRRFQYGQGHTQYTLCKDQESPWRTAALGQVTRRSACLKDPPGPQKPPTLVSLAQIRQGGKPQWRGACHQEKSNQARGGPATLPSPHPAHFSLSPPGHSRRPATPGGSGQSHWNICRGNQEAGGVMGLTEKPSPPLPSAPHHAVIALQGEQGGGKPTQDH